jgi:hypothetical protein
MPMIRIMTMATMCIIMMMIGGGKTTTKPL